jgi:hypothetical protein
MVIWFSEKTRLYTDTRTTILPTLMLAFLAAAKQLYKINCVTLKQVKDIKCIALRPLFLAPSDGPVQRFTGKKVFYSPAAGNIRTIPHKINALRHLPRELLTAFMFVNSDWGPHQLPYLTMEI